MTERTISAAIPRTMPANAPAPSPPDLSECWPAAAVLLPVEVDAALVIVKVVVVCEEVRAGEIRLVGDDEVGVLVSKLVLVVELLAMMRIGEV